MPKKESIKTSVQEFGLEKSSTAGKSFDFKQLPEDILDEVSEMMSVEEAEKRYEKWSKEFGIEDREKFFEALKREKAAMLTEALEEFEQVEKEQVTLVAGREEALAEKKVLRGPDLQGYLIDLQNDIHELEKRLKKVQSEYGAVDGKVVSLNEKKKNVLDEFASRGFFQRLFTKNPSTEEIDGKIREMEEKRGGLEAKVAKAEEGLESKKKQLEDLRKEDAANAKKYRSDPRVKTLDLKLVEIQAAINGSDPKHEAIAQEIVDHYQFIHPDFDFSALPVKEPSAPLSVSREYRQTEDELNAAEQFDERREATVEKAMEWLKEQKEKGKTRKKG